MKASKPLAQLALATMLLTWSAVPQANTQSTHTARERTILLEEINRDFDEAAQNVAGALSDPTFRMLLWHEVKASQDKEKRLDLKESLTRAQGHSDIAGSPQMLSEQSQVVGAIEEKMRAAQFPEERVGVDLYFPVESHRQQWRGDEELLVAFAPVQDESAITSIIAYSVKTGEQVLLNPHEAPSVPTLVIAAKERPTRQSSEPFASLSQPPQQEERELFASPRASSRSSVGIHRLKILDDHEPWYKGKPEIYVHLRKWIRATRVFIDKKVDLEHVDRENRWYSLGDPNATYLYLDANYHHLIEIIVYEEDAGSDDVVGVFIVNWPTLLFGGYTGPLSDRDAQIFLDRD